MALVKDRVRPFSPVVKRQGESKVRRWLVILREIQGVRASKRDGIDVIAGDLTGMRADRRSYLPATNVEQDDIAGPNLDSGFSLGRPLRWTLGAGTRQQH